MNAPEKCRVDRWSNRLLRALPREPLALLEQDLRQVSLTQGLVCFEAGKAIDQVYFPLTGMISLLVATGDADVDGTDLSNPSEALDHATGVARELMFRSEGMLDRNWALWKMSVRDNEGNELFSFRLTGPIDNE